jgi:hypothetical protein
MAGGRGWQFRFEPNIIKQIEQRAAKVDPREAGERVETEVQAYFSGPIFSLSSWPEKPKDVLEKKDLQLALCSSSAIACNVCANADTTDAAAPIPRKYRNAIVAVAPSPDLLSVAEDKAKRLIASEQIEHDARNSQNFALVRDQLSRIKPGLAREFKIQTCRAFDIVVRTEGQIGRIEEKYQVSEEEILRKPQGQKCIYNFLSDKDMIYKQGSALDPDRFLKTILAGATPIPGKPDAYKTSGILERFLAAPGLRLLSDHSIVRQTLLNTLAQGKIAIQANDGTAYDKDSSVSGLLGMRTRTQDAKPLLTLRDDELVTRADSATAKEWLMVDSGVSAATARKSGHSRAEASKLEEPPAVYASTWPDIVKNSEKRALINLALEARIPSDAETLATLAQPLGADLVELEVTVTGQLKTGGTASFEVRGVNINAPIKPMESARMLFNSMTEGMTYNVRLSLKFNEPGRKGMKTALEGLSEKAGDDIRPTATFGKPGA